MSLCDRYQNFRCIFNFRGIDDSGNVANNVETETFLLEDSRVSSHVQVRGSVPLFWEQPGINFGQHKCDIIRKLDGSLPAAEKHFSKILENYSSCHVVNLLGTLSENDFNVKFIF